MLLIKDLTHDQALPRSPRALQSPRLAAGRNGLPYETVILGLGAPKPPEMKAHNPADTIPLMIDGDVVLFESVTILEYIAATYGPTALVPAHDAPNFLDYRQMLMFGEATLAGPLNAIVATMFRAPDDQKQNYTIDAIRAAFAKRIAVVDQRLDHGAFMAGDAFTLADISVRYGVNFAHSIEPMGLAPMIPARVVDYLKRLTDRPAYQRMMQVK